MDDRCLQNPEMPCRGATLYDNLETRLNELKVKAHETHKEFYSRIRELEKEQEVNRYLYKSINDKLQEQSNELHTVSDAVQKLANAPNKVIVATLSKIGIAVVSSVLTYVITTY